MPEQLTIIIKKLAREIGFAQVGIAPAKILAHSKNFTQWLEQNCHGEMDYMAQNIEKRLDVTKLYPGAQSVIAVADNYYQPQKHTGAPDTGKISRYAWGRDYHKVVKKKLIKLAGAIRNYDPQFQARCFVDTAPIMDKQWAIAAGIGWQGKHSNIISRQYGSWLFLGELVTDTILKYDNPHLDFCGNCTACIDACPTKAIVKPYMVDARKCISYYTIEYWNKPIPDPYHHQLDGWLFGCDLCQEVCPWNKKFAQVATEKDYKPKIAPEWKLQKVIEMKESEFRSTFQGTPVMRAKWKNFVRNGKCLELLQNSFLLQIPLHLP